MKEGERMRLDAVSGGGLSQAPSPETGSELGVYDHLSFKSGSI